MQSIEEFQQFLNSVSKLTGQELLAADERGLVAVTVDGELALNLQFVPATGKVLCFVEVAQIPADAPVELYRDLLAAGLFGQETAGGYFSLEKSSGTVIFNYVFDGETLQSPEEFVTGLENVLQLCALWENRISSSLHLAQNEFQPDMAYVMHDIPV